MTLGDAPEPHRAETTWISPEVQESLVRAIPDLLSLLAVTREELELARSALGVASDEVEAAHELEGRLRMMVGELREDSASVRSQLREALERIASLEEQHAIADQDARQYAEAAHLTAHRAEVAEAHIEAIHASRSWRLANPLRQAASLVKKQGSP